MASKVKKAVKGPGKSFSGPSEKKGVNKTTPGRVNRSPGLTNANRMTPALGEKVIAGARADAARVATGAAAARKKTGAVGMARKSQVSAGVRAGSRLAARGGLLGAAAATGAAAGSALYKKLGTKLMDKIQPLKNPAMTTGKSNAAKPAMSDAQSRQTAAKVGKAATKGVPSRSAFGNAFASARKSGKAEFSFKGKRYNTKVK